MNKLFCFRSNVENIFFALISSTFVRFCVISFFFFCFEIVKFWQIIEIYKVLHTNKSMEFCMSLQLIWSLSKFLHKFVFRIKFVKSFSYLFPRILSSLIKFFECCSLCQVSLIVAMLFVKLCEKLLRFSFFLQKCTFNIVTSSYSRVLKIQIRKLLK